MTLPDPRFVKAVFQRHGLTVPCAICRDNHVPAATWRDQEKRCRVEPRRACECCKQCEGKCVGEVG